MKKFKCVSAVIVFSVMAFASPSYGADKVGDDSNNRGQVMVESAGADRNGINWTWLGLLGLVGLFGLKRRNEVRDDNYRTAPSRA